MEANYKEEQKYFKAKKRVNDIKGFYVHLFIYLITIPIIITVNLMFVPSFHWFWFSVLGWGMGLFFHWLGVFGFQKLGLGKDWEEKKIKEFMNKKY
ncbi:2TM domain-containing protein [Polaribacter marinivivus]|uniref:2TM domain-containing protein n=1 Tax=Polaribacter marinivivus TaxID=1524260 RepID=A0ABV8RCT1_9FLAO